MKNLLKKLTVSLSAVVIFISMTATPVPAKAGLLFSASGLGLILIWIGLVNDRADLFFLDARETYQTSRSQNKLQ